MLLMHDKKTQVTDMQNHPYVVCNNIHHLRLALTLQKQGEEGYRQSDLWHTTWAEFRQVQMICHLQELTQPHLQLSATDLQSTVYSSCLH